MFFVFRGSCDFMSLRPYLEKLKQSDFLVEISDEVKLEYEITKELRLVTTFDFRTKTVDLPDGGSESVPSSVI